jgi:hypothetical protein
MPTVVVDVQETTVRAKAPARTSKHEFMCLDACI